MTAIHDAIRRVRESGDFGPLCAAIPYARFLGLSLRVVEDHVQGTLAFLPTNEGNPRVHALHGGTIGALLEFTAIGHVIHVSPTLAVPKTINLTIEYLRSADLVDTFARCKVERIGKRIAVIRAVAYQGDAAKPVATATAHFLLSPPDADGSSDPVDPSEVAAP